MQKHHQEQQHCNNVMSDTAIPVVIEAWKDALQKKDSSASTDTKDAPSLWLMPKAFDTLATSARTGVRKWQFEGASKSATQTPRANATASAPLKAHRSAATPMTHAVIGDVSWFQKLPGRLSSLTTSRPVTKMSEVEGAKKSAVSSWFSRFFKKNNNRISQEPSTASTVM